ncbi:MAG: type IX secretion system sortase PorU [Cytophagales bacterium]|nr:type IX secretion system sortase PorU [Cytophagales bacterium]
MKHALLPLLLVLSGSLWGQLPPLSNGKWHKVSVAFDAVYKIDYNFLKNIGLNPDKIDPRKIQLFGSCNGMLPQPNNAPVNCSLTEMAIHVVGGDDGKFDGGDYILFFGQGPDAYRLMPGSGVYYYENHLYSDKSYYFLTVGSTNGLRMQSLPSLAGSYPVVAEFEDFGYYETEQSNDLHSGRKWYGELFDNTLEYTVRFDQSGILAGSTMKLVARVMGKSFGPSSFELFLNDTPIGQLAVPPVINAPYATTGAEAADTLSISATAVGAPARSNQDVKIRFTKAATGRSVGYLDYLLLQSKRVLSLYGNQKIVSSLKSLDQPVTSFSITNMFSDGMIWDVTNPNAAVIQGFSFNGGTSTFSAPSNVLHKYILLSNRNYFSPTAEGEVLNQSVRNTVFHDFLIITAPEFLSEAERLANHRRTKNGLQIAVVTTTQVYNEYSGGKQDITSLRNLVRDKYGYGLKNVLLFGRGSYDYKNYLSFNKNFVPTYQSRNSLSPLETYSSDDYFGFLESNEGNWGELPPEPHTLDVGVGRIPVKKLEEAAQWVDKVIEYETQNWGPWRKQILFVADDGDFNIHQSQADQMAEKIETDYPVANTRKLYLDNFKQIQSPTGQLSPDARKALSRAIRDGTGIVNFTGHGSELQWMQERILDQASFDEWKTSPNYPFLVTATCEFGRNDDPGLISSAELSLFRKKTGSIGLVTTTRPVSSSTNFTLNKALYQYMFTKVNFKYRDWGSIFRDTKNNSMSGVSNRNFTLLGDPSMLPPIASTELVVTSVTNLTSGSDTLKALAKVRINGVVRAQGVPDTGYQGTLVATLFDKRTPWTTLGDENSPFNFTAWDNVLFRGQASINNGQFTIDFVIPKSIDLAVGPGKLSLYASSNVNERDAMGAGGTVKIGALEPNPGTDSRGPGVDVYMGDTTFISGGLAGTDSRIVAILTDESGIDISNFNPQNDITAILDDTLSINLNSYYQADIDNYRRGKVDYPIDGLAPGWHRLTLKAADTFGNAASSTITFYVSDQKGIQIEQWLNYPNPFSGSTTFHFKHNRSGEDLDVAVTVFDRMGKVVMASTYQVYASSYKVDLPSWYGTLSDGTKLPEGLYLMKLSLRSLQDGTKNEKIAKVIILN